jgi:hypothetical protein
MAGYTRQSVADIIANAVIKAAPVNAEFNAIRDAFNSSTGHKHDGTSAEGAYVALIADLDANNKVVVDTTNNRISFYSEVSGSAVEQVRIQDGSIVPVTDDDIDLGAVGAEFKDLYIDGIGYIDTLAVHENATVAGTLNVTGVITAPAGVVANLTGNVTGDLTGDSSGAHTGSVTGTGDNVVIGNTTPAAGTFTTLTANTSLTAATADINGGSIDGATVGAATPSTGAFTTLSASGATTLATADINGGTIDAAVIGATTPAAASVTSLSATGNATLATVDINGGTIDGATIGAGTASTGAFTTLSATGGITGDLTGDVTGNVTGNVTGAITGNVTGNLTGNVTASSGSSTFNNVTIDGTLNMNAGTTATIQNLTAPTNDLDAATKKYVDDEVAGLVDSAPGALDTLNELAAALGDDADFANTITTSIATKLPLAGGTMTGAIAMGTSKITGLGDPTGAQDAATKTYVDTQDALQVSKTGDTMSGNLAMGSNKVTGLAAPTDANDAVTKTYVDTITGSQTSAAASAAAAAVSESNAATSETNAGNSATAAASSATSAATSYDDFDDRYLGAKGAAPTVDNDGDALLTGALYFDTNTDTMKVYTGSGWVSAGSSVNGTAERQNYTATAGQTVFAATYDAGYVDVWLNGIKLVEGASEDFTATTGTNITLTTGATAGDDVSIIAYGTFVLADHYTKVQSDARYYQQSQVYTQTETDAGFVDQTSATGSANIPVGTTAQRDVSPATGQLRFNSTDASFEGYDGTEWGSIGGGAADGIFYENEQAVSSSYTILATKNAMTAGPITINSGVTVTIETGARWVVL